MKIIGRNKNIVIISIMMMALLLVSSCALFASFDASGYVQSVLDASTRGEFDRFVQLTDSTPEEAQAERETMLDEETRILIQAFGLTGLSEEMVATYRELITDIYLLTRYNVLEAVETDSGFTVDVEIEPLQLITEEMEINLMTRAMAVADEIETMSFNEIIEFTAQLTYEVFRESLASPRYGEMRVITVRVIEISDNLYEIPDSDLSMLVDSLFE